MKKIPLYQSVNGRGGAALQGPVRCNSDDARLGYGYYFWEYHIEAAHWWGREHCSGSYMIYKSCYDSHSEKYFDLVGNPMHKEYTQKAYRILQKRKKGEYTIAEVVELLKKKDPNFTFWAIRAYPINRKYVDKRLNIPFEKGSDSYINLGDRVQMCVLNLSFLLDDQYELVYPECHIDTCAV